MPKVGGGTYFNDNNHFCYRWLRNLFPSADVSLGQIETTRSDEVRHYDRCHFFAGIGGWELALQMAGWPQGRRVWTGSCPCQPFSSAGKQHAESDRRHVWPEFLRLIAECRPATIFGEQVTSPLGRRWIAGVRSDLEALGYAVGIADLCAASVGAPHIRQRLFWVADAQVWGPRSPWRVSDLQRKAGASRLPGFWDRFEKLCHEKTWRVKPGIRPLAPGFPGYAEPFRALGNAIVPQVAAVFIRSFLEVS